jgi:hypothetical protein
VKQWLDAERWRDERRPGAMRRLAERTTTLAWSRALLKAFVEELYPDALFTALLGNLDRVPRRQRPHVLAIAVALRLSWRRDEPTAPPIAITSHPTITTPILWLASAPSRRSAALRPREAGLAALTGRSVEPWVGSYVMVGQF